MLTLYIAGVRFRTCCLVINQMSATGANANCWIWPKEK